jgi:hypothetical protein
MTHQTAIGDTISDVEIIIIMIFLRPGRHLILYECDGSGGLGGGRAGSGENVTESKEPAIVKTPREAIISAALARGAIARGG